MNIYQNSRSSKKLRYLTFALVHSLSIISLIYSMEEHKSNKSNYSENLQESSNNKKTKKAKAEKIKAVANKLASLCSINSLIHACLYCAIKYRSEELQEFLQQTELVWDHVERLIPGLFKLISAEDSQGYLSKDPALVEKLIELPLREKSREGDQLLALAFNSGASIDHQGEYGWTALTKASAFGNINAVKDLLNRKDLINDLPFKKYINLRTCHSHNALDWAAIAGENLIPGIRPSEEIYVEILKLLLANRAKGLSKAFEKALLHGKYKIAKAMLEYGVNVALDDFITVQKNQYPTYLEILTLLLKEDIDINERDSIGLTPLIWAAMAGDINQINLLLHFKEKIQRQPRQITAAFIAAQMAKYDKQKELLDQLLPDWIIKPSTLTWSNPEEEEAMARMRINYYIGESKRDYYSVISILLSLGAQVDVKDNYHHLNALLRATMANDVEMVKLLLSHGADKDITNPEGKTPLNIAKENGFEEIAFLLEQGSLYDFLGLDEQN